MVARAIMMAPYHNVLTLPAESSALHCQVTVYDSRRLQDFEPRSLQDQEVILRTTAAFSGGYVNTIKQSDFQSFAEFYPYYLQEHGNPTCRRLHVVGTTLLLVLLATIITGVLSAWWLFALPVVGYGFAWVGHFFFEKNRPATFKHPWYSLMGDFVMYKDILTRRIDW